MSIKQQVVEAVNQRKSFTVKIDGQKHKYIKIAPDFYRLYLLKGDSYVLLGLRIIYFLIDELETFSDEMFTELEIIE